MCPLILSAIYQYNKKWIYYFSSFTALIAAIIMGYMSTWDNVKEIGRTSMFKAEDAKEEKVEIEMKTEGTSSVPPTEKNQTEVLSAPEGEVKPVPPAVVESEKSASVVVENQTHPVSVVVENQTQPVSVVVENQTQPMNA